jgi:oligopeptide transport system substrate-binding protein
MRLLVPCALLLCCLLAACPKPPQQTSTPAGGGASSQATDASLPSEYRFPLPDDPPTLDPAHVTDTVSDSVCRRIFNTLVAFDADGNIVDDLAEWHQVSPDGLTYKFKLRDNARFHNGQTVTPADVVYSYTRLADPATHSERRNLMDYVEGVEAFTTGKADSISGLAIAKDDAGEEYFKITLRKPYAPFLGVLCMVNFAVVPKSAIAPDPQGFSDNPKGTGPFVFSSWDKGERIVLKANRDYFLDKPKIDTLIFRVIPDEKTRFENFKSGLLEHCDIPPSQIAEVRKDPQLTALIQGVPAMDMYGYAFNCEQPPFKDNTALRQALNFAVDKQNIVDTIWGGMVTVQNTYVPEGMFYYWADCPGYPYNVEKAKQLLEQAGYPGGKGLPEIVLNIDLQPTNKLVAQAVQEDLRQIGVQVRIESTAWGPFLEKIYAGESLFFQNTWLADYPDPDNWLYALLDSKQFGELGNIARWSNEDFDRYVSEAQVEPDQQRRADLYKLAEQLSYDEAPWLLLFWRNNSTLVQPYVKGLEISRLDRTPQLTHAPIERVSFER